MAILHEPVAHYLAALGRIRHPVLREMERYGAARNFPLVGPEVGRLLYVLAKVSGARRVFECGSGFGYSGMWFALALPPGGRVLLTDTDPENIRKGLTFFRKAGLSRKAHYAGGEALETLRRTKGAFDVYFCDIDKESYPDFYREVARRARPGDLAVTDNLLWGGRVAGRGADASTRAVKAYNRLFWGDRRFASVLAPIRDGVGIHLRLQGNRKF